MKKTNENGITLIALVVTIVVLLILAGITITYVMADGGIFDSAKQAASATITSQIGDYASQLQATYMTQIAVKNATGISPSDETKDLTKEQEAPDGEIKISKTQIENFFPKTSVGAEGSPTSPYTITESTSKPLKADKDETTGKYKETLSGEFGVKYQDVDYKVTFTTGVITVEPGSVNSPAE